MDDVANYIGQWPTNRTRQTEKVIHGGIALGLDRLVAILDGNESIKDYIAFPKNNSGKDIMIDAPSALSKEQLIELSLKLNK